MDHGTEHINKLGIKAMPDANGIYKALGVKYGKSKARRILDDIYETTDKDKKLMYDRKNSNYDVAMIFSGGYDANIISSACNWVAEHADQFGDEILEVGCDCGFMTTFLGTIFPDKKITALDRNEKGIKIAKKNVEKFGLNNVTFINADVTELTGQTFDTVFSLRTMHENEKEEKEAASNELKDMADMYYETVKDYATSLSSLVKPAGNLISIERMGMDSLFLAWIKSLIDAGMYPVTKTFDQLICAELDDINYLEAMIYKKEDFSDIKAIDIFEECFNKCTDIDQTTYEGWDAKVMFALCKGKIIKGYEAVFTENDQKSFLALYEHKKDKNCVIGYQNRGCYVRLDIYDSSEKEELMRTLEESLEQIKAKGGVEIREVKNLH